MKPLLLLQSSGADWYANFRDAFEYTGYLRKALQAMQIPYVVVTGGDQVPDETVYCACLILGHKCNNANYADLVPWVNGTKQIPTIVASGCSTQYSLVDSATGGYTGVAANANTRSTTGHLSRTTADGLDLAFTGSTSSWEYQPNTGTHGGETLTVTPIIYDATDPTWCAMWRVDRAGKQPVWFCNILSWQNTLCWMTALKAAGVAPIPYYLALRCDDTFAASMPEGETDGLVAYLDWLRAHGAVSMFGMSTTRLPTDEVKAILLAYPDVVRYVWHDHDNEAVGEGARDTAKTLDADIADRLTTFRAGVAAIQAAGYPMDDSGLVQGHNSATHNIHTGASWRMYLKQGAKVLGTQGVIFGFASGVTLVYVDGDGNRYTGRTLGCVGPAPVGDSTQSAFWSAVGASTEAQYKAYLHRYGDTIHGIRNMIGANSSATYTPIVVSHYKDLLNDNPAVDYLTKLDQVVKYSGGWIKWADDKGLQVMAQLQTRR